MSVKDLTKDQINEMAMIDIATLILEEENKAMDFRDIFDKVAALKGFSEQEKDENIQQFYTDLNINGHFMTKGSNIWGLKKWYPVEEIDEDITTAPKKKKKKKAKKKAPVEEIEETEDLDETIIDETDLTDFDEDLESDDIADDDFDFNDDDLEDDIDDDFDTDDDLEK
ncbi:DNA-directed RNA polymerase subunit delta [Gracilibacillus sp. S3-1-1]|uniref:DNA-directed RNA polymerase subunit delta n=1 Tax=Gracilibacillus pellucidus TaxID=3095368 RepID=A0ACC6M293_9BACI|nr:DNA-directed RNA polymerase subunit delta [Gracilibacillus sp. S3-1-1]MDX8045033.1 DNA-directed RNA polymerase subunit delta [Gracilibacillus sp. S3-1-1]